MPQEEVPIRVRTYHVDFLAAPPRCIQGIPICHPNQTGNLNTAFADLDRSAPTYLIHCALEFFVLRRHGANDDYTNHSSLMVRILTHPTSFAILIVAGTYLLIDGSASPRQPSALYHRQSHLAAWFVYSA